MILDEIKQFSNGAQFRRADLHIHSYGADGSYDVTDATMTPEAIVDTAIEENLQVIAITDHNTIGNVRRGVVHAQGKPLLVVPGVELSTAQGHLLVYCETYEKLAGFLGGWTSPRIGRPATTQSRSASSSRRSSTASAFVPTSNSARG